MTRDIPTPTEVKWKAMIREMRKYQAELDRLKRETKEKNVR